MAQTNHLTRIIKRIFFWLSGASTDALEKCPEWEQRKYVAFGATVLVPTAFAILASSYAMSTLTSNPRVIVPVAIVWGFIILTIDRALLATYRSYQPFLRKISQFSLRLVVAILMGLTISHPLTLLLFKDTVNSVIETKREAEITMVRDDFTENNGSSSRERCYIKKICFLTRASEMLAATLLSAFSARAWVDDGCSLDGFAAVPKGAPGAASKTLLSDPGVSGHSAPRIGVWVDGLLLPGPIVQFARHSRPLCS